MFEIRVLMLWVYRLSQSMNNWVVFLASEEFGAWPRRLPDGYGHGIGSWKEPQRPPFQTDAETLEPRGVK